MNENRAKILTFDKSELYPVTTNNKVLAVTKIFKEPELEPNLNKYTLLNKKNYL